MIRRFAVLCAFAAPLFEAPAASAQFSFGPVGYSSSHFQYGYQGRNFAFGGGYHYSAPVYNSGYYYYAPAPLVIVVPPPVPFVRDREPVPPPPEKFPAADPFSEARVDAALKRGDFVVVKPGQKIVPAAAVVPLPKPPVEPRALAEYLIRQARGAFEQEQIGRAGERLNSAITLQPKEARPHFWLMQVHAARGEYAEAVLAARQGLILEPEWPGSRFDLNDFYGSRGAALAGDLAELKAALAANPGDAGLLFLAGCAEWFTGHRHAAMGHFEKAKRVYPAECRRFADEAKK